MITERDLDEAIAECKGKRNPDASTCIKLAAYYTIKEHLYPRETISDNISQEKYSYAAEPRSDAISYPGDSDFAQAINGRHLSDVWPVIDEMMMTVEAINPRLYAAVMRKLQ